MIRSKKEEIQPMNTAEMWLAAQNDGKQYESGDIQRIL